MKQNQDSKLYEMKITGITPRGFVFDVRVHASIIARLLRIVLSLILCCRANLIIKVNKENICK